MSSWIGIQNQGFDHVEFVVDDLKEHATMWQNMGFEKIGERAKAVCGFDTEVWAQGYVRIILSQVDPDSPDSDLRTQFFKKHQSGVTVLAIDVVDAHKAFEETVKRGAKPALEPTTYQSENGTVVRSEVWTPEDIRYAFIQRESGKENALLDKDLVVSRLESPSPMGVRVIDHLTNNIDMGEIDKWVKFYKDVFGFVSIRHFDIRTGRTGLISEAMQSLDGKITVPINEATEKESQVQEFVDRFKGAGVQHLAMLTTDIQHSVSELSKRGMKFLSVPSTYYEAVPTRVKNFTENLEDLEKLNILLDSEGEGYLLQIFTGELVGPFFLEFIQRKGNKGFGEGNFRALFESIERDQIRRGVLKES